MNELKTLDSQIIEISQKVDSTVKEITMLVHKIDSVNENGLDFLKEDTEANMNTLIDKPVVCKYYPEKDNLGSHEQVVDPKTGKIVELNTIAVGSITDVWIDKMSEDDEVEALYAKATIWSYKYPKIMSVIERLFSEGVSKSSVEVSIRKYGENPTQQYRNAVEYSYLGNCLLSSEVPPADSDAGVMDITNKEIASAIEQDLQVENNNEMKGDVNVSEVEFNKGRNIAYHGKIEVNSLKFEEVRDQIYNLLNPINPTSNYRKYNYCIDELYVDYVVVEDWDDYRAYFKIPYSINDDMIILEAESNWIAGTKGFIPNGVDVNSLLIQVDELNNKIENLQKEVELSMEKKNEELVTEIANKEAEITKLAEEVKELTDKVTELNGVVVTQEDAKKELETKITELNGKIDELTPFKEQVEKATKDAKVAELNSKYSRLLDDETFKSERVQNAITECNEVELNSVVVEYVTKEKVEVEAETEVNSKEDVVVSATKEKELIPQDVTSKYGLSI